MADQRQQPAGRDRRDQQVEIGGIDGAVREYEVAQDQVVVAVTGELSDGPAAGAG